MNTSPKYNLIKLEKFKILNKPEIRNANKIIFSNSLDILRICLENSEKSVLKQTLLLGLLKEFANLISKKKNSVFSLADLDFKENEMGVKIKIKQNPTSYIDILKIFFKNSVFEFEDEEEEKMNKIIEKGKKVNTLSFYLKKKTDSKNTNLVSELNEINNVNSVRKDLIEKLELVYDYNWMLVDIFAFNKKVTSLGLQNNLISKEDLGSPFQIEAQLRNLEKKYYELELSKEEKDIVFLIEKDVEKIKNNTELFKASQNSANTPADLRFFNISESSIIIKVENKFLYPFYSIKIYSHKILMSVESPIVDLEELKKLLENLNKILKFYKILNSLELVEVKLASRKFKLTDTKKIFDIIKNQATFKLIFKINSILDKN